MKWTSYDEVKGCGILDFVPHDDERGYFSEIWNRKKIAENGIPLPWSWAQDNISFSRAGVLRGFHFQKSNPQGKLITVLAGRIMDVCLDIRYDSPTLMQVTRVILDSGTPQSFYLPPGTAHAFVALRDSLIHYRCTTAYDKESDAGINALSPEIIGIWPEIEVVRSEKDRNLPKLMDYIQTMA